MSLLGKELQTHMSRLSDSAAALERPCKPKEHGNELLELKTCATRMSLRNGFKTWSREQAESQRRMTLSPTCRSDWAIGAGRVRAGLGCGTFLDLQLEHGENCSTAEDTRSHHACVHAMLGCLKLADPGITTEP